MSQRVWLGLVLLAFSALAQVAPEREVELARSLYEVGKYQECLDRAVEAMGRANFSAAQRVTLHELAGLSAFNLHDSRVAAAHFLQVLELNPDHQLDPFAVAPSAIRAFEQVRKDNVEALTRVRQQIALQLEQDRRLASEQERVRVEEEERRRRLEQLASTITVRTVEQRSMWVNLIPFGAGQFQQGRIEWGVTWAVSEAVLALTSAIAYFAIGALYETATITLSDRLTPDGTGRYAASVRRIPDSRQSTYRVWSGVKYATGIAFYAAWLVGAVDALCHHRSELVTETLQRSPPAPAPGASLQLLLLPGGLGLALSTGF
jgi:hypothetical protein